MPTPNERAQKVADQTTPPQRVEVISQTKNNRFYEPTPATSPIPLYLFSTTLPIPISQTQHELQQIQIRNRKTSPWPILVGGPKAQTYEVIPDETITLLNVVPRNVYIVCEPSGATATNPYGICPSGILVDWIGSGRVFSGD